MGTQKKDYKETCMVCGKEVTLTEYMARCPETQLKGVHYTCPDGHVQKKCIRTKN